MKFYYIVLEKRCVCEGTVVGKYLTPHHEYGYESSYTYQVETEASEILEFINTSHFNDDKLFLDRYAAEQALVKSLALRDAEKARMLTEKMHAIANDIGRLRAGEILVDFKTLEASIVALEQIAAANAAIAAIREAE